MRNLLISHVVDKRYPQYVCRGNITQWQLKELKYLVGGLALSNFRGASRHAIDSICITAFVSLTMTAVYSNYFLIFTAVISLSGILNESMVASVGNSIAIESREKNYRDMRRFNFIFMLLAGWVMVSLLCLYQPFILLWVGPDLMLGLPEVVLLCIYYYLLKAGDIRWIYHQGAGLWWKARYIVIAEIISNVVLNILLAKYWGVKGIILATLITLFFINFIGGAWILFREYYQNDKLAEFFEDQALYFMVTAAIAVLCWFGCEKTMRWFSTNVLELIRVVLGAVTSSNDKIPKILECISLLVRLFICTLVTVLGYIFVYHRTERYQDAKHWMLSRYSIIKCYNS